MPKTAKILIVLTLVSYLVSAFLYVSALRTADRPILVAECYSGGHLIYMDLIHTYFPNPPGIVITPVAGESHVFVTGECAIYEIED